MTTEQMHGLGARLAALRGERSQAKVAEAVGVTQAAWSQYEKRRRVPRIDVAKRIATYFGMTLDELLGGQE